MSCRRREFRYAAEEFSSDSEVECDQLRKGPMGKTSSSIRSIMKKCIRRLCCNPCMYYCNYQNLLTCVISLAVISMAVMLYGPLIYFHCMNIIKFIMETILPDYWLKSTYQIVKEAIQKNNADRLGTADYAMEYGGGSVLCSSDTYFSKSGALYSILGIPLWYHASSPREVIQPNTYPGNCWAMNGDKGYVTIKLSMPVAIRQVSVEHTPQVMSLTGKLDSAPREFLVLGKEKDMSSKDILLGKFEYTLPTDDPIQVYDILDPFCDPKGGLCSRNSKSFRIITLRILSNHGNPDYTCIYRFRVHGKASGGE